MRCSIVHTYRTYDVRVVNLPSLVEKLELPPSVIVDDESLVVEERTIRGADLVRLLVGADELLPLFPRLHPQMDNQSL